MVCSGLADSNHRPFDNYINSLLAFYSQMLYQLSYARSNISIKMSLSCFSENILINSLGKINVRIL